VLPGPGWRFSAIPGDYRVRASHTGNCDCGIIGCMPKTTRTCSNAARWILVFWLSFVGCGQEVPGEHESTPAQPDARKVLRQADQYYYGDDGTAENPPRRPSSSNRPVRGSSLAQALSTHTSRGLGRV
jgi:hypothetical protein